MIQNLSLVLNKTVSSVESVRVFDQNPYLVDLFIAMITYWLQEPSIKQELFIVQSVAELLDAMVYSHIFWQTFKQSPILHTFI